MFAKLQYNELKPVMIVKASADLVNGAPVSYAPATGTVGVATGADPMYVVTSAQKFEGINAVIEPSDDMLEEIKNGELCLRIPLERGDRFATTEVSGTPALGDKLTATSGKFAKASTGGNCAYCGTYDNPWGLAMHIIEVL